jgi:hypothetical protein
MSSPNVSSLLPRSGTTCTIDASSATGTVIAEQLARLTGGAPIVIRDAQRQVRGTTVTVTGKTTFLNVADAPVTAVAKWSPKDVQLTVRFTLIDGRPGRDAWTFSRSFPELPPFRAGSAEVAPGALPPDLLDRLPLADAAFVLTTDDDARDWETDARLDPGLNFVARCAPTALLGLLGEYVDDPDEIVLRGLIVVPRPDEEFAALGPLELPWLAPRPAPGIHLTTRLEIEANLEELELELEKAVLHIYCPTSKAWVAAHPTYRPVFGIQARLEIDGDRKALNVVALGIRSTRSIVFSGRSEGVTLDSLDDLEDTVGDDDLARYLPHDVRHALSDIEPALEAISIQLGPRLRIESVSVAVRLPGLHTDALPGLPVRDLRADFQITRPFGPGREVLVALRGSADFLGAPFDAVLALPDVHATAHMQAGATLPLGGLIQAMGLPAAPELAIDGMELEMNRDGSYAIAAAMAPRPAWTLDLGPTPLVASRVRLVASRPASGAAVGSLSGVLTLGEELELAFDQAVPGPFLLRGELPDVRLRQLVATLGDRPLELPAGFDLTLEDAAVQIQRPDASLVLRLATTMPALGTCVFEARRVGAAWGVAAGVELSNIRLSSLPGLGALGGFEDLFQLDRLLLVASSFTDEGFAFPRLAAFDSPLVRAGDVLLPAPARGVSTGVHVYGRWTVGASREQVLIQRLLRLEPALGVTLRVGSDPRADSRLAVDHDTTILGHPLHCQLGGRMADGHLRLFVTGDLSFDIDGANHRFDAALRFVAGGAIMTGTGPAELRVGALVLSNPVLSLGVSWAGAASLGLAASLSAARFPSSVVVLFDGASPPRSMVAGAVLDLSLADVVETFAGAASPPGLAEVLPLATLVESQVFALGAAIAPALDGLQLEAIAAAFAAHGVALPTTPADVLTVVSSPGERWSVTDLTAMRHYELVATGPEIQVRRNPQLLVVPEALTIGARRFDPAISLDTRLQILSFGGDGRVEVSPGQGIVVDGHMDRIVAGTEALFSIAGGAHLTVWTFARPAPSDASQRDPQFRIDGRLSMLGLDRPLTAALTPSGFAFAIEGSLGPDLTYDLRGVVAGPATVNVAGRMSISVGPLDLGALGSVDIASGVTGAFELGANGSARWATYTGGFSFAGERFTLPALHLDVNAASLPGVAPWVLDRVVASLKTFFLGAPIRWAMLARAEGVTGVRYVAGVLKDAFAMAAPQTAAAVMKAAGHGIDEIVAGLEMAYGLAAGAAAAALQRSDYAAGEVAAVLRRAYGVADAEAVRLLREAGYRAGEAAGALISVGTGSPEQSALLLRGAGYPTGEVAGALRSAHDSSADAAAALLAATGHAIEEVTRALESVYSALAEQAASALRGAGQAAPVVAGALKAVYGVTAEQSAQLLKGAAYTIDEVAGALELVFGAGAAQATTWLEAAGYDAGAVGGAIKSVFDAGPDQLAALLTTAGFATGAVGSAIRDAFGTTADQAIGLLRTGGYSVEQAAATLRIAYGTTPDQAVALLKGAGYGAGEAASALRSAYGERAEQTATLLKGAGYTVGEVGGGLRSVYGATVEQAAGILATVGYTAAEVGGVLKSVYGVAVDQVARVLRGASYTATEAVRALQGAYGAAMDQAAILLKAAGYVAGAVGGAVSVAYGATIERVTRLLEEVGYTVDEVTASIQGYGSTAEQAAGLLKGAGYAVGGVASALKSTYGVTKPQAAKVLQRAGYSLAEVASALRSAHGVILDDAAPILKDAGYSIAEVGGVLKSEWAATADLAGRALKGAAYTLAEVGAFLRDGYGLEGDPLQSALEGSGYTREEVKAFLATLGGH